MNRKPRLTMRQTLERNNAADRYYAAMAGKPPQFQAPLKPQRAAPKPSGLPLESDIQADIIAFLRNHPKVKLVERHNSGTAVEQNSEGKKRFIRYSTVFKVNGQRMRKSDIDCTLTNGKRFVCEVKRPPWKRPTDQREYEQAAYIEHIKAATGYGLFATSVEQVASYLDAITV